MGLQRVWTGGVHTMGWTNLTPNADSTHHQVDAAELYVPAQAHILRLVCNGGVTVYGRTQVDQFFPALPHVWSHEIYTTHGGVHRQLNLQAGAMTMSQAVTPRDPTAFTGTPRCVSTTYTGHLTPVDQRMSYGSVAIDDGDWHIYGQMLIGGVHDVDGADGVATHFYDYIATFAFKVLYEILIP